MILNASPMDPLFHITPFYPYCPPHALPQTPHFTFHDFPTYSPLIICILILSGPSLSPVTSKYLLPYFLASYFPPYHLSLSNVFLYSKFLIYTIHCLFLLDNLGAGLFL